MTCACAFRSRFPIGVAAFFLTIIEPVLGQRVEPARTWRSDRPIEWCEAIPHGDPSALVICDADGWIEMLNLITHKSRLTERIPARRGARWGGVRDGRVYVYDRDRVTAISVTDTDEKDSPRDRLLWSVGDGPDLLEAGRGDPEFLTSILAAVPTRRGILIIRSDGSLAELDRENGAPRWRLSIPPSAEARIRVLGDQAAVLFKLKAEARIAWIDLSHSSPSPGFHKLGDTWPLWCELSSDGLVAAWPARIALAPWNEDARPLKLKARGPFSLAGIELFRGADAPAIEGVPPAPPQNQLLLLDADAQPGGYYLSTEKMAWRGEAREAEKATWSTLALDGRYAVVQNARGRIAAFDAGEGALCGLFLGPDGERAISAGVAAGNLFGLRTKPGSGRTGAGGGAARTLELVRTPLMKPGEWTAAAARATQAAFDLGPSGNAKRVLWPRGRLVIVEDRMIRTYILPD